MALNLADSAEIMAAYDAVVDSRLNWFLLHYSNQAVDEFALYAFGDEGLEELKTRIDPSLDSEQVLIGFLRVDMDDLVSLSQGPVPPRSDEDTDTDEEEEEEEEGQEEEDVMYLLVGIIPKSVLGVRRARVHVHIRRLGMIFKKHDAVLTVDGVSQLTNTALGFSLAEPEPSLLTFSTSAASAVLPSIGDNNAGRTLPLLPSPISPQTPNSTSSTTTQWDLTAGSVVNTPLQSTTSDSPLDSPIASSSTVTVTTRDPRHPRSFTATTEGVMDRSYASSSVPPAVTYPSYYNSISVSNPLTNVVDLRPVTRSVFEPTAATDEAPTTSNLPLSSPSPTNRRRRSQRKLGAHISRLWRRKNTKSASTRKGFSGGDGDGGHRDWSVDPESQDEEYSSPPPTPPKDKGVYTPTGSRMVKREDEGEGGLRVLNSTNGYHHHTYPHVHAKYTSHTHRHELEPSGPTRTTMMISELSLRHTRSISEFAVISHEEIHDPALGGDGRMVGRPSTGGDKVVIRPDGYGKPLPLLRIPESYGIDLLKKGKWAGRPQGLTGVRDPAERARLRMEMQKQREEEEKEILRVEEERQARIKREKEELLKREEEEVEKRKVQLQAEALRVAAERRRREEAEREEEERRAKDRENRKRVERQKRMEEHLKLEEWRTEQQRVADKKKKAEEEARKRGEEERKRKIREAGGEVKVKAREGTMMGWVTIQMDESVVWRRRYFKFSQNIFYFYRGPEDMTQVVDQMAVRGTVKALKEPKDGYEELKAIPHSFVIEFYDRGPWAMYADTEEEKFRLLVLVQHGVE